MWSQRLVTLAVARDLPYLLEMSMDDSFATKTARPIAHYVQPSNRNDPAVYFKIIKQKYNVHHQE